MCWHPYTYTEAVFWEVFYLKRVKSFRSCFWDWPSGTSLWLIIPPYQDKQDVNIYSCPMYFEIFQTGWWDGHSLWPLVSAGYRYLLSFWMVLGNRLVVVSSQECRDQHYAFSNKTLQTPVVHSLHGTSSSSLSKHSGSPHFQLCPSSPLGSSWAPALCTVPGNSIHWVKTVGFTYLFPTLTDLFYCLMYSVLLNVASRIPSTFWLFQKGEYICVSTSLPCLLSGIIRLQQSSALHLDLVALCRVFSLSRFQVIWLPCGLRLLLRGKY